MKKRINLYLAAFVLILGFASCEKPPENLEDVKADVNPSPLVVVKGEVKATINLSFPEKFIPKKSVVELIPVLVYNGTEKELTSAKIQGDKAEDNFKVISSETGGSISIPISFKFEDEMRISDLMVKAVVTMKGKEYPVPAYKIADGIIATETLVNDKASAPAIGADNFVRIIPESATGDIHYLIQQAYVRGSEMNAEDITALKAYIKAAVADSTKEFTGVDVSAYASPDGAEDLNTRVAGGRENSAAAYIKRELKRAKVEELSNDDFVSTKSTPEDWEGFKELMEASDIQDKELILRVLSMYSDPETREKEIKNLSAAFKELADEILPQLRRAKLSVNLNLIGKTDAEIAKLADSNPSELNVEELLYSATLTEDADKKIELYKKVTSVYPKCWRGFNNLGSVYFSKGEFDLAEKAFVKADKIKGDVAEVQNNLGVIALVNGDVAKAKEYFGKAAGIGDELNYNLGVVAIHEGNYSAAVKNFGGCKNDNAILAKILAKDLKGAKATIDAVKEPTCLTNYLSAIVSAKSNDKDGVMSGLKKAVDMNPKFKEVAKTDIEFAAYFEEDAFKAIVE